MDNKKADVLIVEDDAHICGTLSDILREAGYNTAIADVYQALISDRPYRKAYSRREAGNIIKQGSGTQFDPDLVETFLAVVQPKSR